MKKQIRPFLKMACFAIGVLIGAQLTSIEPLPVVLHRLEVLVILWVISGLAFLLVRE